MNRLSRRLSLVFLITISFGVAQRPPSDPLERTRKMAEGAAAAPSKLPTKSYLMEPDFGLIHFVDSASEPPVPDPFAPQAKTWTESEKHLEPAREVLMQHGIPFPEGSMASFDAVSRVLTVRNTTENLLKVDEWILDDGLEINRPHTISITAHLIEAPGPVLRAMASELTKKSDHSLELNGLIKAAPAQGENVKVLETLFLESKSGQQCNIVSQCEFVSTREVQLDTKGRSTVVSEVRPLGLRIMLEPVINADAKSIDITISSEYSPMPPDVRQETVNEPVTGKRLEMPVTDFDEKKIRTSFKVGSGASRMLGVWNARRGHNQEARDVAWAFFVTSHIVPVHNGPTILPSAREDFPINSDALLTRVFDVPPNFDSSWTLNQDSSPKSEVLKNIGIAMPKGAAIRLESPGKLAVTNTLENLDRFGFFVQEVWEALPRTVVQDVQIIQAPAQIVRSLLLEAAAQSDHKAALTQLKEEIGAGKAICVDALHLESKPGQQASISSMLERQSVGEVSWSGSGQHAVKTETRGSGIKLEIEPILGSDGITLDLNYRFEYHPAAHSTRREIFIEPVVQRQFEIPRDAFNVAKVVTSTTLREGSTKIIGVWKPTGDVLEKGDVLQVAFLTCRVVRHEPKRSLTTVGKIESKKNPTEDPQKLIKVSYRIPPDFLSLDGKPGPKAGKRPSAQEILEAQGIPFPEGAYALFNGRTSRLIVRNTRNNLDLIEAFTMSIGDFDPKQCAMTVHLFEGNAAALREMVSSASGRSDHREELNQVRAVAKPIGVTHITTKSGQQVMTEDVREVSYFTGTLVDDKGIPAIKRETIPVGLRFEVEPTIGADGWTLDLNSSLNYHTSAPVTHIEILSHPVGGDGGIEVPLMDFFQTEVKSSISMSSGTARILGLWKPRVSPGFAQPEVLQIAIIEAEILLLDAEE